MRAFQLATSCLLHGRILCIHSVAIAIFVLLLFSSGQLIADDLTEASPIYGKLATPMNSVFDGKSFRSAISGIAEQIGLNVWVDRRIDPTTIINIESSGSTVYGVIEQIAASRDCVLMPIGNVLLVGRREWVAKLTATIQTASSRTSSKIIDVAWDDLATPATALNHVIGNVPEVAEDLPHDLWPKTTWTQIRQDVAITLILAQFDLQFDKSLFPQRIVTSPMGNQDRYERRYSSKLARSVRPAVTAADKNSRVKLSGKWLQTTASFDGHLSGTQAVFAALKPQLPDPDKDTFTLKQMRTNARSALQQLCGVAGRRCEIATDARQACEKIVTVEGQDATLRELIELVAKQAGVKATWGDGVISISM